MLTIQLISSVTIRAAYICSCIYEEIGMPWLRVVRPGAVLLQQRGALSALSFRLLDRDHVFFYISMQFPSKSTNVSHSGWPRHFLLQ